MGKLQKISIVVAAAVCCGLLPDLCLGFPLPPLSDRETGGDLSCSLCMAAVEAIQDAVDSNRTLKDLFPLLEQVCVLVLDRELDYFGPYMCPGFINAYIPVLQYALAHAVLEPRPICQALHLCNRNSSHDANFRDIPTLFQSIHKSIEQLLSESPHTSKAIKPLLSGQREDTQRLEMWKRLNSAYSVARPRARSADSDNSENTKLKGNDLDTITILQLADIHIDPFYSEGAPTDCHLFMCCRSWYNGTKPAGRYGDFECDLPNVTLNLLLDTIRELDPQPDFIVYTGDIPAHDIWNDTWSTQFRDIEFVVDLMAERLPNITIYPAMGNHETWPESQYIGSLSQYQILTQHLAKYWQKWVDFPAAAIATITDGGYYTIKIEEGLRLIAFNSDYGDLANFYAFLNQDDQYYHKQWEWLTDQLAAAEQAGEKVLLIAHIPPGQKITVSMYEEFYLNMTKRFGSTIVGHLFGHTHKDQFRLVQDKDGLYGVLLVAPSVTPFGHINPSFRVFSMNRSSHQLLGYHQYHLNLTKANELAAQGIKPQFELAYTTSQEYGLKDLSPESWAALVMRFEQQDPVVADYHYNVYAQSKPSDKLCDDSCRKETLCAVTHVLSEDYVKCLAFSSEHLVL